MKPHRITSLAWPERVIYRRSKLRLGQRAHLFSSRLKTNLEGISSSCPLCRIIRRSRSNRVDRILRGSAARTKTPAQAKTSSPSPAKQVWFLPARPGPALLANRCHPIPWAQSRWGAKASGIISKWTLVGCQRMLRSLRATLSITRPVWSLWLVQLQVALTLQGSIVARCTGFAMIWKS